MIMNGAAPHQSNPPHSFTPDGTKNLIVEDRMKDFKLKTSAVLDRILTNKSKANKRKG